jgi:4'-phosphopantetheinyl transferase
LQAAEAAPLQADELRIYWRAEIPADASMPRRERIDRVLRNALAPVLGVSAAQLQFGREAKGRPFVRHPQAPDFNLSDTVGGTLIAMCRHGRIGVDLERVARRLSVARLAARYFDDEEAAGLRAMEAEDARAAFLRLWTAKEASCKATGTGIFGYLDQWRFDVHAETPLLRQAPSDAGDAARWRWLRLSPSSEHTAVLALRDAPPLSLRVYTLID